MRERDVGIICVKIYDDLALEARTLSEPTIEKREREKRKREGRDREKKKKEEGGRGRLNESCLLLLILSYVKDQTSSVNQLLQ